MYDEFFAKAHELVQQGTPFVTAVVVRSESPTSGKPGDKAIVTVDGVMHGWIGGSCAQPTVIQEALKALAADEVRLIRLSPDPEAEEPRPGVTDLPMVCFSGGTLEVYLEPQAPRPRLLIVGALPLARALAHLGEAMNYHTIVVDLDGKGEPVPHAAETLATLEEMVRAIRPFTYVVVATHGNYDEMALEQILRAQPVYVGLVASPKRAQAVREYLTGRGVTETELLPLKAPAGLDIQARRGDEIALSIMAEIVQRRRNGEEMNLALFQREETAVALPMAGHHVHEEGGGETAVDPICGMEVAIAAARYTHDHDGVTYYFCCAGCQQRFAAEPEKFLAL